MTTWAKPGVKCVCVDAKPPTRTLGSYGEVTFGGVFPVEGQVYTIREVEWYWSPYPEIVESFLGVHLREILRPASLMSGDVVPYRIERFRPLIASTAEKEEKAAVSRDRILETA